jgi:hypothetical protein
VGGTANVVLVLYEVPKLFSEIELLLWATLYTFIHQTVRIMMRSGIGPPHSAYQNKPLLPVCMQCLYGKNGDVDDV